MVFRVFIGLLAFTNLFFWNINSETENPQTHQEPLVKGAKDVQIFGATFKQEIYYGVPGFNSIEEQLDYLGISLGERDKVVMIPRPELKIGGRIEITRANKITLIDAKAQKTINTWTQTVGELLDSEKIKLDKTDKLDPALDAPLSADTVIKITRIGVKQEKTEEKIDFKTVTKIDPSIDICWQDVTQAGKPGILTRFFKVTYENGDEVARVKTKEEITTKPIDKIITKGSKITSYGQGKATWYRWNPGEAAHNSLPRGTRVKVTNLVNGKSTIVKITDRGIHRSDVVIDLDAASFEKIAPLGQGITNVRLEKVCS